MKPVLNIRITPPRVFLAVLFAAAVAWATGNLSIDYNDRQINGNLTVSGTVTQRGAAGFAAIDAGAIWVRGGEQVVGTLTAQQLLTAAVIDAGTVLVRGDEQVAGALRSVGTLTADQLVTLAVLDAGTGIFRGDLQVAGNFYGLPTTVIGDITLGGQSPATATATVRSGAKCVCSIVGGTAAIATKGVACNVSSTTLTATSQNAASEHVQYICF